MSKFEVLKGPTVPFPTSVDSLRDLLEAIFKAALNPTDVVVAIDAKNGDKLHLDYLEDQSLHVAKALASLGASRIGICFTPSLELIVLLAGLVRRGGSYVALDPSLPTDRLNYIINDSGVDVIVYDANLKLNADSTSWTSYQELIDLKVDEKVSYRLDVSKEDTFCVLYTSGSTGRPKGVMLPHRAIINRLIWQWSEHNFEPNEVVCFKTQIGFVDSLSEVWASLLQNVPIVVANKSLMMTPGDIVSALAKFKVTRITIVPSLLRVLLAYLKNVKRASVDESFGLSLKYLIASGEDLAYDLCQSFFDVFDDGSVTLGNFYGSTEVTADVTAAMFTSMDDVKKHSYQGRVSIGSVVSNVTAIVHDLDSEDIGELVFAGAGVTSGYLPTLSQEQNTLDKFVKASDLGYENMGDVLCFRSGDRGKVIDGQFLVYFGRNDSQVKISGNRVDLSEIELILKDKFDCVNPVVLFHNGRMLVFLAKDEQGVEGLTRDNLLAFIPSYAIPTVVTVDTIPHLPVSGKIDRQALRSLYDKLMANQDSHEVNWDEFSSLSGEDLIKFKSLVTVLQELKINATDTLEGFLSKNFFSVGGSSLNAILAISLLKQKGYHIDVHAFLSAKDLKDIVGRMDVSCEGNKDGQSMSCEKVNAKYKIVPSSQLVSIDVIKLIARAFVNGESLMDAMRPAYPDYDLYILDEMEQMLEHFYSYSLKDDISFSVLDSVTGKLIGSCHNLDENHQPADIPETKLIGKVLQFLGEAEHKHVEQLKAEGITRILHGFVMAVDRELITNLGERVELMLLMEREILRVAKDRGFEVVITTNTSKLTCDLAEHVLDYSVLETIGPVSEWKYDLVTNERPFAKGPPDMFVKVCIKRIL